VGSFAMSIILSFQFPDLVEIPNKDLNHSILLAENLTITYLKQPLAGHLLKPSLNGYESPAC